MLVISDVLFYGLFPRAGKIFRRRQQPVTPVSVVQSVSEYRKVGGSNPPRDDLFFDSHFGYVLLLLASKQLARKSSKYNQRKVQHVYLL